MLQLLEATCLLFKSHRSCYDVDLKNSVLLMNSPNKWGGWPGSPFLPCLSCDYVQLLAVAFSPRRCRGACVVTCTF